MGLPHKPTGACWAQDNFSKVCATPWRAARQNSASARRVWRRCTKPSAARAAARGPPAAAIDARAQCAGHARDTLRRCRTRTTPANNFRAAPRGRCRHRTSWCRCSRRARRRGRSGWTCAGRGRRGRRACAGPPARGAWGGASGPSGGGVLSVGGLAFGGVRATAGVGRQIVWFAPATPFRARIFS